jgi:ferredoxin
VGEVRLDGFYAFWVPLARAAPAWVHLLTWGAAAALLVSVPWWWRPRPETRAEPSFLDEGFCTGCTQCSLDCPYEAIAMVPRTEGTGSELVARVDPVLCVSCGICAGSCAPMEIGPPLRNGKAQLREIQAYYERLRPGATDVVVLSCRNGVAEHPLLAGLAGVKVRLVHCAGGVHTSVVEYLIRRGVGGVYLLACPERDCVYREGPKWLRQRLYNDREAELHDRVDRRRVRMGTFPSATAFAAAADVRAFREALEALRHAAEDEGHLQMDIECEAPPLQEASDG